MRRRVPRIDLLPWDYRPGDSGSDSDDSSDNEQQQNTDPVPGTSREYLNFCQINQEKSILFL